MLIKLLLPILFPSWRFFSSIGPSPRIDLGFVDGEERLPDSWVLFRPIPQQISKTEQFICFFHNPAWNEFLYINTCAENLFEAKGDYYPEEISRRLLNAVARGEIPVPEGARFLRFRIRAIYSEDAPADQIGQLRDEVFFVSSPYSLARRRGPQ